MTMKTIAPTLNGAKHASKMAEWRIRIRECRNSGQTVKSWCKKNGVSTQNFYRWQKIIWESETSGQSIATIPGGSVQFAEIPEIEVKAEEKQAGIVLHKGDWQIELQNNANPELVYHVIQMVGRYV